MKEVLLVVAALLLVACDEPPLETGEQLFLHHCAGCHKPDGSGKFFKGSPSLRDTEHSLVRIRNIMRGHQRPSGNDSRMPEFTELSVEEQNKIVAYIHREIKGKALRQ